MTSPQQINRARRARVVSGPAQRIQAVDRAVELLRLIASSPRPLTVIDLSDRSGLNRSTTWRLLGTLEHHGLVERDPTVQGYLIGSEIINLGARARNDPLVRIARPVIQQYANILRETITLAVPRRLDLVYVDQVNPPGLTRPSWIDQPLALHATSGGKVFLASLSDKELRSLLAGPLERFTVHTITEKEALIADVLLTRRRGYGCCDREYEEYSNGVGAPVVGHAGQLLAIVAVWGPSQRITSEKFPTYGEQVLAMALEISTRIGRT